MGKLKAFYRQIRLLFTKSMSRQFVLGIALTHGALMTVFIVDLVDKQKTFLLQQNQGAAIALAETLATNATSWILSNDIVGIEELIHSQSDYPNLNYALLVDTRNRVLGFDDRAKVGMYLDDEISASLLTGKPETRILIDTVLQVEIAVPILVEEVLLGWARINLDRHYIVDNLKIVTHNGLLYMLLAIVIGTVFAWIMAKGLTTAIRNMIDAAKEVREGNKEANFYVDRVDELGELGLDFGNTVKALAQNEAQLQQYQEHLEQLVQERTTELEKANQQLTLTSATIQEKNENLESAYQQLKTMQDKLIESEKLSSLGALVAGVSHELNTPLGVAYTGISAIQKEFLQLQGEVESGALSKSKLIKTITNVGDMACLTTDNIDKVIVLVNKFKQISVQEEASSTTFSLTQYTTDCIKCLAGALKQKDIQVDLNFTRDFSVFGDPKQFVMVLDQLVNNSLLHGFKNRRQGNISISFEAVGNVTRMRYSDDGHGLSAEQLSKLYDPFYTTSLGQGDSGLGMHIVYNIIKGTFNGSINCRSEDKIGIQYDLDFPLLDSITKDPVTT